MTYAFKSNIRATCCDNDVVVLDLNSDRFHILPSIKLEHVNSALEGKNPSLAQPLIEVGFIKKSNAADSLRPHKTDGFFEQRWMTPIVDSQCTCGERFFAMRQVALTNFKLRHSNLNDLLTDVDRINPKQRKVRSSQEIRARLNAMMAALNFAFSFDLTGNKCLAYSYSLTRMAKKMGIPASLVIGVRTSPFFAHAWVESANRVINDDPLLRSKLAVIVQSEC